MIKLSAKIRNDIGKKTKSLRKKEKIPAIVYGSGIENVLVEVDYKEFKKVFDQAGESSLVSLEISGEKKERPVLIYETQKDYLSGNFTHIDFYQASLKQEVEVMIPLVFEGIAPVIKELGGTLVKEMHEIKVKALPQNLPHNIVVDISGIKTFEDEIFVKDLKLPADVKVLKGLDEIVVLAVPIAKVDEELAKPIEEEVENVEKVEKERKEKDEIIEEKPKVSEKKEDLPAGKAGKKPEKK
jgi:large subunit ribosomal protein L25